MSKKPKLFAWDFHGTLEHGTDVGFAQILRLLSQEYKIARKIELVEVRKLFGSSIMEYLGHFFPGLSGKTYELMRSRIAQVQNQEHIAKYIKPSPYAKQVLRKIKASGHKNIVVSNSHPRHIGHFIDTLKMGAMFDEVYAIDRHYSGIKFDAALQKAKSIKDFAAKNNVGEIIVIGDAKTDIEAGHKVGAITIQYIKAGFPKIETRAHFKTHLMLVDTHCHLDFTDKPQEWIDNATLENVLKLICVGTSVEASQKCVEIAEKYSNDDISIFASVGLHPEEGQADIEKLGLDQSIEKLKKIAQSSKKVVAVGECGLDYYPTTTSQEQEKQGGLFKAQVKLANDLNLPLIVHCRNGWSEIFRLLSIVDRQSSISGVFHSWTGDWEACQKAIDLGFYISFSGILTFKNAPVIQDVAKRVSLERVVLETDSPFLTPEPLRSEYFKQSKSNPSSQKLLRAHMRNEPKNVKITARFLANLRGESPDRIEGATSLNAEKLFKI